MQQGHPRHKQLSRAIHEMYLHGRHNSLVGVAAIGNLFSSFGESTKTAYKKIQKAFGAINEPTSVPNVDYDKFEIKDIATDMFRNNAGIVGYGKSQTL